VSGRVNDYVALVALVALHFDHGHPVMHLKKRGGAQRVVTPVLQRVVTPVLQRAVTAVLQAKSPWDQYPWQCTQRSMPTYDAYAWI